MSTGNEVDCAKSSVTRYHQVNYQQTLTVTLSAVDGHLLPSELSPAVLRNRQGFWASLDLQIVFRFVQSEFWRSARLPLTVIWGAHA